MKFRRFSMKLLMFGLLFSILAPPSTRAMQYPKWLYGATGYGRAIEVQHELNIPLIVYFYTDRCANCRTLDEQYLASPSVRRAVQRAVAVRINPDYGMVEGEITAQYQVSSYPAFFIMDKESSVPRNVQPFRPNGHHLTPEQFARACEAAMTFSPLPPKVVLNEAIDPSARATSRAVMNAARQTRSAEIVVVPSGTTPSSAATKTNRLPTIDSILIKYVEAIGGRKAQEKLKSRVIKGRVKLLGANSSGQLTIYAKAPDKSLTVISVEPVAQVKHGFDGRTTWNVGETAGSQTLTDAALPAFSSDFGFYREIRLKEIYPGLKLLGIVKEKEREFYQVESNSPFGGAEIMYFEIQSGLLSSRELTQETLQGPIRVRMRYSDWREVDGVKLPYRITQSMRNLEIVFTVNEIKHNTELDDKLFEKPL
jgi:hypothetical protein